MVLARKQEGSLSEVKEKLTERKIFEATVCKQMIYQLGITHQLLPQVVRIVFSVFCKSSKQV